MESYALHIPGEELWKLVLQQSFGFNFGTQDALNLLSDLCSILKLTDVTDRNQVEGIISFESKYAP